jgi:flagellar motility protein MotE (MotC chaperone)
VLLPHTYAQAGDECLERQKDLALKEESVKKEAARVDALKAEIDAKLEKYQNILKQIEESLKKLEQPGDERFKRVVKDYEAMPPEEAGARISALDEETAANLLLKMNPKKAGAAMAQIEPKKVASLTEKMVNIKKSFPVK